MQVPTQSDFSSSYEQYVKSFTPSHNLFFNMLKAFFVGGMICVLGQFFTNIGRLLGLSKEIAASWCSLLLILCSVLLTGFHLYGKLGKFAGAGALVPITGFANSVASAAIEYRTEGQVFGIGSKIFLIAGPVILYGIFSSWLLGLLYFLFSYAGGVFS